MRDGNLPEGWELTALGNAADNLDGKRVPLKMSDRDQRHGEYPYYGASGVIDHIDDFLFDGEHLLVAEDGANLLARTTPIAFLASGRFWVNNHAHVLTFNGRASLSYLQRYLCSIDISSYVTGSAQPKLNQKNLDRIEIPLPPLSEQKRIADILDKADAIRRKRQVELDTLSALRSSVFLRLFGDPRTHRTEWPEVSLGDVTVIDAPMVDPREDEFIDLVHLGPDRIEKNTGRLLPALTAREEGLISGKFLFDERHLLYSKIRPYLRKVALPHFKGLCSADVYPIRPVENLTTREYLFALLISEAFLAYTTSLASRASIPKLNRRELAAYSFNLPPIDLQQHYTDILRSHKNTTETFGRGADESENLFNSLVQRAFNGEL